MFKKYLNTLLNFNKNVNIFNALKTKPFGISAYKRVYHHHLMKTGGTSLNKMFLNLSGEFKKHELYGLMMNEKDLRIVNNNWVFVSWNQLAICTAQWHYAWSHRPIYKTIIPSKTFVITVLRDPYERVFSRYKHLLKDYNSGNLMKKNKYEYEWLGSNFEEYLHNIPDSELCHQLFMFSNKLDIEEAMINLSRVNFIVDLNRFSKDISAINKILGIQLEPMHTRKNSIIKNSNLKDSFGSVMNRIEPEIEFYYLALKLKNKMNG